MAVRPITVIHRPDDEEVLRAPARKVRRLDASIRRLVEDLIDSMHAASGVGIAAPQIGVSLRVVVIGLPGEPPFALINPEIVKTFGERRLFEGCLSVPGYRGEITRAVKVVAKALDINGKAIRIRAEDDLLAQALEHEINHLNGILYIDHVQRPENLYPLRLLDDDEDNEAAIDLGGDADLG